MKFGAMGSFVKFAFAKTSFDYLEKRLPSLDMTSYKRRALLEYRAIVARTPSVGPLRNNMFVVSMYAAAFVIALYKTKPELLTPDVLQGLVQAASYCPLMRAAKEGKSAFTKKEIRTRTEQAAWSREHIDEYPMNWYWFFEKVPNEDEYYITHKQCGICKLCEQEGVSHITRHLCAMDYYTFEMQGAVLDRTKTLGYGDDECNFHLMSAMTSKPLGLKAGPQLSKKTFCAQRWKTTHRARNPCRAFACERDRGLSFHSPLGSHFAPMMRVPIRTPWRATVSRISTVPLLSRRRSG